jgi:stage IV sporulation protein FB
MNFTLVKLFGVPVRINILTILYIIIFPWALGLTPYLEYVGLLSALLLVIVTGHEFAHILMARFFGYRANVVYLTPIGGAAEIEGVEQMTAKESFFVSLAGPLFNFALAPICYIIGFHKLAALNLIMGVFNLIPFYPMDGGRILKALLSKFIKNNLTLYHVIFGVSVVCFLGFIIMMIITKNPLYFVIGILLIMYNIKQVVLAKQQQKLDKDAKIS